MLQVKLMQKMKEDANKMKQMGLQHHRAVSQLRKEHRKHENQVSVSQYCGSEWTDTALRRRRVPIFPGQGGPGH